MGDHARFYRLLSLLDVRKASNATKTILLCRLPSGRVQSRATRLAEEADQVKIARSEPDLGAALRWASVVGLTGRKSHWSKSLKMRWNKERFFGKLRVRGEREYRILITRYRGRHNWYDQTFEEQEREWNRRLDEMLNETASTVPMA